MRTYIRYWLDMLSCLGKGDKTYYLWMGFLSILILSGVYAYSHQLRFGFIVTNLSNQVSWGAYIANFTFLVGVAAAAVLLVVPSYVYGRPEIKKVVIIGELLALASIVMCLLFVTVDLGNPQRFIHMIPPFGKMNFPESILAWDVIVLTGYLLLNLHIPGYLLYQKYRNRPASKKFYMPFVYISMIWAISIHTVTAFLFSGFGSRPFWNSAILAPRFLISAFSAGPALIIIIFHFMNKFSSQKVEKSATEFFAKIIAYTLPTNLFLFMCELFKEFYSDTLHNLSARYLLFGIHGHAMIAPYVWAAIIFQIGSACVFIFPVLRNRHRLLLGACVFSFLGIWIEKGMGLIVPGFLPTPLGDLVEYTPSWVEFFVCLGIWSVGAFLFTAFSKVAIAINTGKVSRLG